MTLQNPKPSEDTALKNFSLDWTDPPSTKAKSTIEAIGQRTINFPRKTPSTSQNQTLLSARRSSICGTYRRNLHGKEISWHSVSSILLITQPATLTLLSSCRRCFNSSSEVGECLVDGLTAMVVVCRRSVLSPSRVAQIGASGLSDNSGYR